MPAASTSRAVGLFATPVIAESWPEAARFNQALRAAIVERRASDPGVSLSNILGWQSGNDMTRWGGDAARALSDYVTRRADGITFDKGQTDPARRFAWSAEMWANVSERGASNQTHSHPGAYWSAVYYVDDGYGGSDDPALGGQLVFLDPRFPMVRMRTPDLRYRRPDGSGDHHEVWMRPAEGRIVIFPSWLSHSVRPFEGPGTRISIAINLVTGLVA